MIYGIDLGTTNSLIGYGDEMFSGLVSSNVDMSERKQVPRDNLGKDVVASYKTNMSMSESGQLSIECSSIILDTLVKQANKATRQDIKDIVVSVPAYFSTTQREAVYKAAEKVGLTIKTLINEPTAAALYVCRDVSDLIIVFDLGGGTFDVTIIDSRFGDYSVVATDGIVLGGDNLDEAIMNRILKEFRIPMIKRSKDNLKLIRGKCRLAKEHIQKTGSGAFIDMSDVFGEDKSYYLDEAAYIEIMKQTFAKTVEMTENLILSQLPPTEHPKMVFVGGSTNCPYLREYVSSELKLDIIESDIKADYIVAKGAALYAEMYENGKASTTVDDVTKRLCIEDEKGMTLTVIDANTHVPCRNSIIVKNSSASDRLILRVYQGNSIFAADNEYVGSMEFMFDSVQPAGSVSVEVTMTVRVDGVIRLAAVDVLDFTSEPQEIQLTRR